MKLNDVVIVNKVKGSGPYVIQRTNIEVKGEQGVAV